MRNLNLGRMDPITRFKWENELYDDLLTNSPILIFFNLYDVSAFIL